MERERRSNIVKEARCAIVKADAGEAIDAGIGKRLMSRYMQMACRERCLARVLLAKSGLDQVS